MAEKPTTLPIPDVDTHPYLRVAAGARFLDDRFPGWWRLINLDDLDLGSDERCVIGQLAERAEPGCVYHSVLIDGYGTAIGSGMRPALTALAHTGAESKGYGFVACGSGEFYQLMEAWRVAVKDRIAQPIDRFVLYEPIARIVFQTLIDDGEIEPHGSDRGWFGRPYQDEGVEKLWYTLDVDAYPLCPIGEPDDFDITVNTRWCHPESRSGACGYEIAVNGEIGGVTLRSTYEDCIADLYDDNVDGWLDMARAIVEEANRLLGPTRVAADAMHRQTRAEGARLAAHLLGEAVPAPAYFDVDAAVPFTLASPPCTPFTPFSSAAVDRVRRAMDLFADTPAGE